MHDSFKTVCKIEQIKNICALCPQWVRLRLDVSKAAAHATQAGLQILILQSTFRTWWNKSNLQQLCDAFTAIMQNSGVQLRGGTKTLFKRSWNLWARRLMRITAAKCKSRQGHHGQVHSLFTAAWLTWECMQCAHEHLNYWSRWIKVIILHGSVTGWITFALEIAVFSLGWRRLCQRLILVSRLIWTKSSRIS